MFSILKLLFRPSRILQNCEYASFSDCGIYLLFLAFIASLLSFAQDRIPLIAASIFIGFFLFLLVISLFFSIVYYIFLKEHYNLQTLTKFIITCCWPLIFLALKKSFLIILSISVFIILLVSNILREYDDIFTGILIGLFPFILLFFIYLPSVYFYISFLK